MAQMMARDDLNIDSTEADQANHTIDGLHCHPSELVFEELPNDFDDQSAGVEIHHPDSVEEQDDDSNTMSSDLDGAADFDLAVALRFQKLRCDDKSSPTYRTRDQTKRKWKTGLFKRTHSQSADDEVEERGEVESPNLKEPSMRRIRRRIGSPNESDWVEELLDGSVDSVPASRPSSEFWDDGSAGESKASAQTGNAVDVE